jgi:hypothetical protein
MRLLSRVVPVALIIALGAWCRRDALQAGFWSDDYLQYAMLHGKYPLARASWDLYRFSDGSSAEMQRHLDFGSFPWWSDPHFKLALLRPLASLSHAFDYRVFGTNALAHHIHSFAWWALSVVTVAGCLARSLSWPSAVLATCFYALDEAPSIPILWICNRSVLMAAALGFAALWAHLAWRQRPAASTRAVSIALFAAALATGEYALSMLGYFVALELLGRRREAPATCNQRQQSRERALPAAPCGHELRSLAPFLGLSIAFVVGSTSLGYGSANSGIYVSPMIEPGRFLSKLIVGVPILSADIALTIPADWWTFGAPFPLPLHFRELQMIAGVLVPLLAALALRLARPGLHDAEAKHARWWGLGAMLSLAPVTGSFITTRLVVIGSAGAAAVVATIVVGIARRASSLRLVARATAVLLALGLCYLHGVRAARLTRESTSLFAVVTRTSTTWGLTLQLDPQRAAQQRVIQIAAIEASNSAYLPFIRAANEVPMPRGFRILSPMPFAQRVTRVADNALEVAWDYPPDMPNYFHGALSRSAEAPFVPGATVDTAGVSARVLETQAGVPKRVLFTFDVPLEDPSLVFIESSEVGLRPIALPKLGETQILPPPRAPSLALLLQQQMSQE